MNYNDQIFMITGGTGSFGNAMVDKLLSLGAKEIRILSRDELKQDDMRHKYKTDKLKFYIGDIRDFNSINYAFEGVDYVFHAAALKQVPSCEFFPMEAVKTNIEGSNNVVDACIKHKVKKVVFLSTDKACYPINAMGMSKALMEKNVIAKSSFSNDTIICCTRYGNVMASRGSVIPLFTKQIKTNQEITITNPEMTRFMMTLDEACDLVLYAFEKGQQGDLFIQKAGASTIAELADSLIEIFNSKSKIKIIGTRHGEKLYESLATSEELQKSKDLGGYYCIPKDSRTLNYDNFFSSGEISKNNDSYHSHNTNRLTKEELKNKLLSLEFIKKEINE
ncbi:MAG: polysaccharide biosynthesis protein [Mycoplasma sp.]